MSVSERVCLDMYLKVGTSAIDTQPVTGMSVTGSVSVSDVCVWGGKVVGGGVRRHVFSHAKNKHERMSERCTQDLKMCVCVWGGGVRRHAFFHACYLQSS